MLVLGIAAAAALLIPLVTRGSYRRLFDTKIHWGWLLGTGLAIQLVLIYVLPRRYWHGAGFWLLLVSYGLILVFVARNFVLRGMTIVFIGIACNALVIALNHGMPVKLPADWKNETWTEATVIHHPKRDGEQLIFLSDIIIVRSPFDTVLSFGDLILAVGLCDVAYNASRDPKRARRKAQRKVARTATRS